MNVKALFDGLCIVKFVLSDGSVIECTTTLNQKILERYGVAAIDGLVDLLTCKPIPEYLLDSIVSITPGTQKDLGELDSMFENATRISWEM